MPGKKRVEKSVVTDVRHGGVSVHPVSSAQLAIMLVFVVCKRASVCLSRGYASLFFVPGLVITGQLVRGHINTVFLLLLRAKMKLY